jgi:hypothetical protein
LLHKIFADVDYFVASQEFIQFLHSFLIAEQGYCEYFDLHRSFNIYQVSSVTHGLAASSLAALPCFTEDTPA